jgi:hypothetical protein
MTDAEIQNIWAKVATYDTHLSDVLAFARAIEDALLQSSIPPEPQAGVELTDDEINELWVTQKHPKVHNFARAIERALNQRQAVKAGPTKYKSPVDAANDIDLFYIAERLAELWHAGHSWDGGNARLIDPKFVYVSDVLPLFQQYADQAIGKYIASVAKPEPLSAAQGVPEGMALPELDDGLVEILGRPNFHCINLANLLRRSGRDIPRKSEYEQAHVLHFLLSAYLTVGPESWREQIQHECNLMLSAAPEQAESKEGK